MESQSAKERVISLLKQHAARRRDDDAKGVSVSGGRNTIIYVSGDLVVDAPREIRARIRDVHGAVARMRSRDPANDDA